MVFVGIVLLLEDLYFDDLCFYGNGLIVGGFNGFYGNGLIVGGFNGFCGKILNCGGFHKLWEAFHPYCRVGFKCHMPTKRLRGGCSAMFMFLYRSRAFYSSPCV